MDPVNKNSIYAYADYRSFIRDVLQVKKKNNPNVSLATIGKKVGMSKMAIKYIVDGKRHIAERNIPKFSALVPLGESEAKYFRYLVCFNKAKTEDERKHFFSRMMAMKDSPFKQMIFGDRDTALFLKWFHGTILEMMSFKDFKLEPTWIAQRLRFEVSEKDIAEGIDTLIKLGFIGEASHEKTTLVTPNGIKSHVYKNFLKTMADKSKIALDTQSAEDRQFFYLNISVSEEKYQIAKKMIDDFKQKLHNALANDEQCDRVLQINMQMFHTAKEP
ncbi:MAG: TIGR02147 family protein [Oligoflexales bacterium]